MAYQNLGRPDQHLAMAVDARQELDLSLATKLAVSRDG